MEEKRTLIETFLPVEEISAEAKKEKNGRAPTFELHYWWTRKPLVAARSTVLGALLPHDYNIKDFKRLIGLKDNQKKRAHNHDINLNQIETLKKNYEKMWGSKTPTILDPFAGGGSIPFETIRVGCNTISNDYNPVSCYIQKATFEYPIKYGSKLLNDVEIGLNWLYEKSKEELSNLYPKHDGKDVAAYIYSWVVTCPECGFKNPMVGQWWLVRVKNKRLYLDPKIIDKKLILTINNDEKVPDSNISHGKGTCLNCGVSIPKNHVKNEIFENDEEKLLAVVVLGKKGKEYYLPNSEDINGIKNAEKILKEIEEKLIKEDLIPTEEMPDDLRGGVWAKLYLKYWHRLLNPRQKILFSTLIRLIKEYSIQIKEKEGEEYALAVSTYLSLVLGKHINRNCRSTKYDRTREGISGTTSLRGIPMLWDHTETNPFVKSSGSLPGINKSILKSLEYSLEKTSHYNDDLKIYNNSILESDLGASIIVTDPPYFDDVQYAELSELFYVFERRALKEVIDLPNETPKSEDMSVGGKRPKEVFEHLFPLACSKMNSMLTENGILVMYFAHSSVEAWDFVVNSLRNANFRITATWPIHTENPNNPLGQGNASILSSIVIVARKRKENKTGYIEEIQNDIEIHLKKRLKEFWNYGLRGADITVAAMGATLDILTNYSSIKSYTGEMTVKDILELVEIYVVEYILDKFLKNTESLDSPTRFYVYCRLSELDGMSFDTANLISKSLNINLKSLESSGNISSITRGRRKGVKILKYDEREDMQIKTMIDAVQLSLVAYEKGGMKEFESVLSDSPYTQREIYNILESFKHLQSGDSEKQIAMQILGKSNDIILEKGQTTFE